MFQRFTQFVWCFSCILISLNIASAAEKKPSKPKGANYDPVVKKLEGWTIHVDPAMLKGEHQKEGTRALRMLGDHLHRITILMSDEHLKRLRKLEIWIEYNNPKLGNMQYHPSVGWLKANGHDRRLAKKVHIPRCKSLTSRGQLLKHPMVILHELSHAYHDQYLGFNNPKVIKAYQAAKKSGKYDKVLLYTGRIVRHYGMNNEKEYFAEATEAYFGRNDFFPFVRAELKNYDPQMHDLLVEIWGKSR
jgi:hypothetical protein